jgi:hypothetical protein
MDNLHSHRRAVQELIDSPDGACISLVVGDLIKINRSFLIFRHAHAELMKGSELVEPLRQPTLCCQPRVQVGEVWVWWDACTTVPKQR